jgi:ATPase subunit of ABC transporter with duplicated ATPase domains
VLDHASVTILEGERVGLVGRNGSGKSTFLQIAAGLMAPDSGEMNLRRDLVVGYMPQIFELDERTSVHANILAGAQDVLDLIHDYETAPPESARSGILLQQIEHFDGWNLEHRIKSLITQPTRTRARSGGLDVMPSLLAHVLLSILVFTASRYWNRERRSTSVCDIKSITILMI